MRTLDDALKRAENLRDFRKANDVSFENTSDYQDIVNLADEVERLSGIVMATYTALAESGSDDDHDESWGKKQELYFFGDGDGSAPIYERIGTEGWKEKIE